MRLFLLSQYICKCYQRREVFMHYNNCNQIIARRKVINCHATINQFLENTPVANQMVLTKYRTPKKSKKV